MRRNRLLRTVTVVGLLALGPDAYAQEAEKERPAAKNGHARLEVQTVTYREAPLRLQGYLARPKGKGPFPVVVYNHGGLGGKVGGCPKETAQALAEAGFVGFSPLRRKTVPLSGHPADVEKALKYVKTLPYVDKERVGLMGFSRGGLLTFMGGVRRSDLSALVIMAPAPGQGTMDRFLPQAARVRAPSLVLVSKNDNVKADHVALCKKLTQALKTAGRSVDLIVYPPYKSDGHTLFFQLGSYWKDVVTFLKKTLME